jgi:hypothetical protein
MTKITKKKVETYFKKPIHWPLLSIIVISVIGLAISFYFIVVYSSTCGDEDCFSSALVKCDKGIYLKETAETITEYKISGEKQGFCEIEVELIQIKQGSAELISLEGEGMVCLSPLGTYLKPEENLKECHGLLKEGIQEIMIQRMHSELIENIGQIGEEITKVL